MLRGSFSEGVTNPPSQEAKDGWLTGSKSHSSPRPQRVYLCRGPRGLRFGIGELRSWTEYHVRSEHVAPASLSRMLSPSPSHPIPKINKFRAFLTSFLPFFNKKKLILEPSAHCRAAFAKCSGACCKARWTRSSCSTATRQTHRIPPSKPRRMGCGIFRIASTTSDRACSARGTCRLSGRSRLTGTVWLLGGTIRMSVAVGMRHGGIWRRIRD